MLQAQRGRLAFWLILPALVMITAFKLAPIIEGVIVSLQNGLLGPKQNDFVGLRHYRDAIINDGVFGEALWRTIIWTAGSVAGGYIAGLSIALLLNRDIAGRGMFRALFLIPWVIPEVAAALLWKWLYSDEFGVLNFLLMRLGITETPVLFLASPNAAMASVIAVQVWKLYPVMFITLLAALQSVPRELHEAAEIDGAGALQRFWFVTFPHIRQASVIITLLASIWTFQSFDIVYLLTGGGPAGATKILPVLVYEKGFWAGELGYAAAVGMLILFCLLILAVAYLFAYSAQKDKAA